MKRILDILQLWFLASLCSSFFSIIGSVGFVFTIVNIFRPHGISNHEAFYGGLIIAVFASGFLCLCFLFPFVVIKNLADDQNDYGFSPWVTGIPSVLAALFFVSFGEGFLYFISGVVVFFGFLGGWIFGRTYEYLYDRKLDARNKGFFEIQIHSESQN